MGAQCTSQGPCTRQGELDEDPHRTRWPKRHGAGDEDSPFSLGQRIVLTPTGGCPELGTVRFVGFEQGGIIGIELDAAGGAGNCNGYDVKSGSQHFTCEHGKGIYIKENSSWLQPVLAAPARSVSAVGKLSLALETLEEQETLHYMNMGQRAQAALLAVANVEDLSWFTAFRKVWDPAQGRYTFCMRSKSVHKRLATIPHGARVLSAEGGPDDQRQFESAMLARLPKGLGLGQPDHAKTTGNGLDANAQDNAIPYHLKEHLAVEQLDTASGDANQPEDEPASMSNNEAALQVRLPRPSGCTVTPGEAHAVFEHCHHNWEDQLPCSLLLMLARSALGLFNQEPSVRTIMTPHDGKLVVVGDLHGHFKDLIHIWRRDQLPSHQTWYLFNGNICGQGDAKPRGGQDALKIWACILSFKLAFPNSVHVNKGSHEDHDYSAHCGAGGLYGEISSKYEATDACALCAAFGDLCGVLPLATVVDKKVLVLHGGLPRRSQGLGAVTFDEVARITRPLQVHPQSRKRADQILMDITWSDPQDACGRSTNVHGSGITNFGPDVTADFLAQGGLTLLVRSHQLPGWKYEGRGCEWWHPFELADKNGSNNAEEGLCLSIFSASDYGGHYNSNSGGTVSFTNSAEVFNVSEHSGMDAEYTMKGRQPDTTTQNELHALAKIKVSVKLIAVMLKHRHRLSEEFTVCDTDATGFLSVAEFRSCCQRVIPGIAWNEAVLDNPSIFMVSGGRICYSRLNARYKLCFNDKDHQIRLEQQFGRKLYTRLIIADRSLRESLLLPGSVDGAVHVDEFLKALAKHGCILPSDQVKMMFASRTATQRSVQVNEFLGSLVVDFATKRGGKDTQKIASVPAHLDAIFRDILSKMSAGVPAVANESVPDLLRRFFERNDQSGNGFLKQAEFADAVRSLPSGAVLSDQQIVDIVKYLDADKHGRLSYLELFGAMEVRLKGGRLAGTQRSHGQIDHMSITSLIEDLTESVCHILIFEYGLDTIRSMVQQVIPPGSTHCKPDVFKRVLMALSAGPSELHLSSQQLDCLMASLDLEQKGEFNFEAFLSEFSILDTESDQPLQSRVE